MSETTVLGGGGWLLKVRTFWAHSRDTLRDYPILLLMPFVFVDQWREMVVPPLSALLARSDRRIHLPGEIGPSPHAEHAYQSPESSILFLVPWLPYPGMLVASLRAACPIFFVGFGVCR